MGVADKMADTLVQIPELDSRDRVRKALVSEMVCMGKRKTS